MTISWIISDKLRNIKEIIIIIEIISNFVLSNIHYDVAYRYRNKLKPNQIISIGIKIKLINGFPIEKAKIIV